MRKIDRRKFLRASGVAMGLPLLGAMVPGSARAAAGQGAGGVRRMVAICSPLGFHTPNLFPERTGRDYEVTDYLVPLQPLRERFSVISGLMHPGVDGGHPAEQSFLTGAPHPARPSFRNSISVDQFAAERLGHETRIPSLALSANNASLSVTRSGVRVPPDMRPSALFAKMFLEGSADEKAAQMRRIRDGRSIMDLVHEQAKALAPALGRDDHETLDQYFTSVRELELKLAKAEEWAEKPKPVVEEEQPSDIEDRSDFTGRMQLMYDLIFLALRTDSTRLVTFCGAGGNEVVALKGVDDGWHNLSHHGKDPDKLDKLAIIEREEMRLFAEFCGKLESVKEGGHSLLENTAVLLGSNLGNASSHSNTNLPIVVAGGRFRHGQHLGFDPDRSPPLANLLVSFLQHLRLEVDEFSSGRGTLAGLDGR
jgi:hypothetical protein